MGGELFKAGKHLNCRGHCGVGLDKEKEAACGQKRFCPVLFAQVSWSKAKDIAQEKGGCSLSFCFCLSRKTQKNVCVKFQHVSV